MNCTLSAKWWVQPLLSPRSAACAAVIAVLTLSGCETVDYRMSVSELQIMERQLSSEAVPEVADEQALMAAEQMLDRSMGPYALGAGDVIGVTISGLGAEAPPVAIPVRVNRNGEVDLPTVGAVQVRGMELEDAELAIKSAFVPNVFQDASVHVTLNTPNATRVVVTGAVTTPGVVSVPRTESNVVFAINAAGGLMEMSSGKVTVRRVRRPTQEVVVDISDPHGLAAALALEPLQDGDLVRVHSAMPNMVFVGGLVNMPMPQTYPNGIRVTVLQALAGAGGLRQDVFPREATLVRRLSDGNDAHVRLDLERIKTGDDTNIELAAGDVLWVPHTVETRIQEFINQNIFLRAGVVMTYEVQAYEDLHSSNDSRSLETLQDRFDPFGFTR